MVYLKDFLVDNMPYFVAFFGAFLSIIINLIFSGKKNADIYNLKEEIDKLYCKFNTARSKVSNSQTFDTEKKQYKLVNEKTNELEELPDKINIMEYINSYIDTALDKALIRIMPEDLIGNEEYVAESNEYDVDRLAAFAAYADSLKQKYGLPDDYSAEEVFAAVKVKSDAQRARVDEIQKSLNEKKNVAIKEVKENETL